MRPSTVVAAGLAASLGAIVLQGPSGSGGRSGGGTAAEADAAACAPIAATLDSFHAAAANADEERYFGHFAPSGVFLGTDPTERWTVAEFRAWARPYFARDEAWTYHAIERHIDIAPGGECAWFDEVVRNAKYGDLRGTGVVLLLDGEWKIAQYNLTFQIPNDDAAAVLEIITHED